MQSPIGVAYVEDVPADAAVSCPVQTTAVQQGRQSARPIAAEAALESIAGHRGPMLIDFDETLLLCNSTECFIDCAWPGLLALLLLRLLDLLKPWKLSGGEITRDNWRVGLIVVLMPWTWLRWKRRVATLAIQHANWPLQQALRANGSGASIIVTLGFSRIIAPLARAMGMSELRLVGSRIFHPLDRRGGKLALCRTALGEASVTQALAVSDSLTDLPLLDSCKTGLLVQWPEARLEPALRRVYLPGRYISRIKHPGQRYILRAILQEDFTLWILASVGLAASPLWHSAGLLLLLISFWAVYEQGYADNDRCGARYERNPKLSAEFFAEEVPIRFIEPWVWAAAFGTLGLLALRYPLVPAPGDFLRWAAVLGATHLLFRFYNRIDKSSRVWLYSGLQFARGAAFVAVVAIPPVGVAALGAHLFARWTPYYFYRQGGRHWVNDTLHLMRLILFCWLAALLAMADGIDSILNWTAAALLAWNVIRARRELTMAWKAARRIDRQGVPS